MNVSVKSKTDVVIVDAVRTPMARAFAALQECDVSLLARHVLAELAGRHHLTDGGVASVIMGSAVLAGAGQNFLRRAVVDAGLPVTTPTYIISNVCGSGLQAVIAGTQLIRAGDGECVITGGVESASHSPELVFKRAHEEKTRRALQESLVHDGLWCSLTDKHMGLLCEGLVHEHQITRIEQDDYAFVSYQRALAAQVAKRFEAEIVPIQTPSGKRVVVDETIRRNIQRAVFNQFPPAFMKKTGTVTAGNSSVPCDGAAAVVLASAAEARRRGWRPLAKVLGHAVIAGNPHEVFALAADAVEQCLERCGLSVADVDLVELSEAFAAQAVLLQRRLGFPLERMNIYGGDLALGHPLGAAGARVVVTLTHALHSASKKVGVCVVCLGGGGALAMALERA